MAALDILLCLVCSIRHMQRKKGAGSRQHVVKRLPAFLLLSAILMLFPA
jgi:hypothetical protein